jgi:hypothetical protein
MTTIMDMSIAEVRIYAEDEGASFGIGIVATIGVCWWIVTIAIPWPNIDHVSRYKHAIWFIWTYTGRREIFSSYLPTAYLASWVVNFFYLLEAGAWLTGG